MPENEPQRLSEVVDQYAPQGTNDARWFFVEHQLAQVKFSIGAIQRTLREIADRPENGGEGFYADGCLRIMQELYTDFLSHYATHRSYLSDTDVPERISRKEV